MILENAFLENSLSWILTVFSRRFYVEISLLYHIAIHYMKLQHKTSARQVMNYVSISLISTYTNVQQNIS